MYDERAIAYRSAMRDIDAPADDGSTTAKVLHSLDAIVFEVQRIDDVIGAARRAELNEGLRDVRRRVLLLRTGAEDLLTLLSEVRLELGVN